MTVLLIHNSELTTSMNVNEHPELELLKSYLRNSAAMQFSDLRLHLAECSECRHQLDGLMGLQQVVEQLSTDVLSDQQHQHIADYINGGMSEAECQQQKLFLHSSPAAMKAALHYVSHKSAMDKSISEPVSKANHVSDGLWKITLAKLKALTCMQTPIWFTVPTATAIVALLAVNVFNQPEYDQSTVSIANYQDNAIIQFRSKDHLPGIGFFAKSDQLTEAYNGVKVSVSESGQFNIQWPPVPGAIKYNLRLQVFDKGIKTVLGEVTTKTNSALIPVKLDNLNHRYEWVLSGETGDNRVFFVNGGFVISIEQKGIL